MTAQVVRLGRPVVYSVIFEVIDSPVTLDGCRYWCGCCLDYGFLRLEMGLEDTIDAVRSNIVSLAKVRRPMKDPSESFSWSRFSKAWEAETHGDGVVVGKFHAHLYPNNDVVFGLAHLRGATDAL